MSAADQSAVERAASRTLMFQEAREGGAAAARFLSANGAALAAIAARLRERPPATVITCARGSSDHAATYAKYLIETRLGIPTASAALSVASLFSAPVMGAGNLCLAISQSGRSQDLLDAVKAQRDAGATVIALVNDLASPLVTLADEVLSLEAGPERSVAATKSYCCALVGIAALVAEWAEDAALQAALRDLPAMLDRAFALDWAHAVPLFMSDHSLFVIGRGYGLAIAQEAALKMKETCGLHAEAFSAAEVRHGPMTIVGPGFPVLAFATSDDAGDGVRAIAAQFEERGACVALADTLGTGRLAAIGTLPMLEPILMVQSFYRFVNELAVARGYDPDKPPHLHKVTSTR